MRRALACSLAAGVCLLGVTTSGAQTVGGTVEAVLSASCDRYYGCVNRLRVAPTGGVRLDARLWQEGTETLIAVAAPAVLRLRADPQAGDGCVAQDAATIRCRAPGLITAAGGPGDDRIDASGMSTGIWLSGGAGADELAGGAHDDVIAGGPGVDRLDGGEGRNTVDLSDERAPIAADLDAARVSTGDAISGFDGVIGGAGDDLLVASPTGSQLTGGPGNDRLRGGVGADRLEGDAGTDRLEGAAGNDVLIGDGSGSGHSRDLISCGPGSDRADAPERSTVWIGCEELSTPTTADPWLLRSAPARVLVARGIAPDFPATYTIVVRRPDSRHVIRRIHARVTSRDRRRSRYFRVPLAGPAADVTVTAVAEIDDGTRSRSTTRLRLRIGARASPGLHASPWTSLHGQ